MTKSETPVRFPRLRRLAVVLTVLAALLVPAAWLLPDQGLRWGLLRTLVDMGWSQVQVGQAHLSLWRGEVAVRGVEAMTSLGEALGIDGIDLTFRWKPLLSRQVWLDSLELDKAEVALVRDGDTWRVNGLELPQTGGDGAGSLWGYGVASLVLTNSVLRVEDGPLKVRVAVDRLEIRDLRSWEPAHPASLSLVGKVNDAPLSLSGTMALFAPHLDFAAELSLKGLDTRPFAQWGGLPGWGGALDAALTLKGTGDFSAPLRAEGRLSLANGVVPLDGGKVAAAQLTWQGRLEWRDGLTAQGTLDGRDLLFTQGQARIAAGAARVQMGQASLDKDFQSLDWSGALNAADWALDMDGLAVRHKTLDWQGKTHLNLSAQAKTLFTAEGRAEGGGSDIRFEDWRFAATKMTAEGRFAHDRPRGLLPPVAGQLSALVDGLAIRQGDRDWLLAETAQFDDWVLDPASLRVGRFEAKTVSALGRAGKYTPRLRARLLRVDKLALSPGGDVRAEAVTLAQPVMRVNRDHTGIEGLADLPKKQAAAREASPHWALGHVRLTGGQVEFRDRTTAEPVRLSLRDLSLTASAVDSAQPDQDSPFSVSAAIGNAEISAQGQLRPFRPSPGVVVDGRVRGLDLPPLSPYAAHALGVNLHTGQLDARLGLSVVDGALDGKMDLVLSRLRVAQPDPNAPLAKQADMPIETVLALLRDGDDRITLAIPVRGDVGNPNFDTSDAVNQAIGGALRSTVFTTLKVAFPLIGLIGMVIDEAERPVLALDSLDFAAGAADLAPEQQLALDKVVQLMREHQGVGLNLCGVAARVVDGPELRRQAGLVARLKALMDEKDREELAEFERQRLVRLAESRAAAVKSWLVDEGGVEAGRLFTCRPRVEDGDKAQPRVDLVL